MPLKAVMQAKQTHSFVPQNIAQSASSAYVLHRPQSLNIKRHTHQQTKYNGQANSLLSNQGRVEIGVPPTGI